MIRRGTVLLVSPGGAGGRKPRPSIVVQADGLDFPETITVVPLTTFDSSTPDLKPTFLPDELNGLKEQSSLMIQRIGSVRKSDIGGIIGDMSGEDMERIDAALMLLLGLDIDQ
jgi:mRNA interferase MazF